MACFEYSDKLASEIHWDRLREAYVVIDQVADEYLDLGTWSCATVACAAGHLCQTPKFNAYGLTLHGSNGPFDDYRRPRFRDDKGALSNFDALAAVFNMPSVIAVALFEQRDRVREAGGTDRQVWLARLETLFEVYNQELTNERKGVQEGRHS